MNIPKKAKKVFDGIIFDVYQWEQKLYNGQTKTFEMLDRVDSANVIAVNGDTAYYAEQEQPPDRKFFSVFGGQIDPGESPLAAAKRELREESGLVSDDWELWRTEEISSKISWKSYVYIARGCTFAGEQQLEGGEKITVKQAPIEEFFRMVYEKPFLEYEIFIPFMRMELGLENKEAFLSLLKKNNSK